MKLFVPNTKVFSPHAALQKAGYFLFTDPNTGKESYILRLTADFYPRFHIYVKLESSAGEAGRWVIDLHLDQKKPSYGAGGARGGGSNMHSGEYDGPVVEKELVRIEGWVKHSGGEVVVLQTASSSAEADSAGGRAKSENDSDNEELTPIVESDMFGGIF